MGEQKTRSVISISCLHTPPNSSLAFSLCLSLCSSLSLSCAFSSPPPGYCCWYLTVNASHNPVLPPPLAAVFLLIYCILASLQPPCTSHVHVFLSLSQPRSIYLPVHCRNDLLFFQFIMINPHFCSFLSLFVGAR